MKIHPLSSVIIVDKDKKPMAWSRDQLCYCDDESWQDEEYFSARVYTVKHARALIKKSTEYRRKNEYPKTEYFLMPIIIPR